MKITLLVVGKTANPALQTLTDDYCRRLMHYVPFSLQVIPDLKNSRNLSQEEQKQREGSLILNILSPSDRLILLDERGKEYRSMDFAQQLNTWLAAGQNIVFVVGGPYGFSSAVYERANGKLSLSQMTFSHQMIRLFFTEQLYRAMTILRGEPYHHE
ncbi:MAG TPA: 23S rRNA (pseudouridine(1915)-N(3))-methyltransferase RlmH [Bacteroidales bacterium]|nr:23S rRNA (pseudouridine(1915)-N(3))-methyltransferase RlmH [Bacteroidales bacterium]